ncbi:immunoglobulin lambda-1 light chain-like [Seriola aureovittata]|uniref:immunoglobulin lambda-1 light chain-like n=1 Tax=Seriola aureovittata TaxID=2871759 RepID=UPI0024BD9A7C|nr:immunoglobulin lambda-1 light chain-like [Seriola aureovittata]
MLGTLCTLITALTYIDAVIVLTQTPAVHTVSTGQEVVLNCNIQKDDGYYVSWYKQVPGAAPQYILRFYHSESSPTFGTGFSSDRFNSKSSSDIDYQFIIKRSEAGDSAQYFCQTWDKSAKENVSQGREREGERESHFRCALNNLPHGPKSFPLHTGKFNEICLFSLPTESKGLAEVTWFGDGCPVSSGISTSTAVHQPDHTFQISSYFSIKPSQWLMDKVFTCKVSWGSQSSKKNITMSDCHMN